MTTAVFFALEGTLLVRDGGGSSADGADEGGAGGQWRVPDGAREALLALGESCHIGLITNADRERAEGAVEAHDLPVETVVSAVDAGAPKPDAAAFESARERVDAEEYVMVGDDYEEDVEGARAAGFVPVHYEREGPNFWETLLALV